MKTLRLFPLLLCLAACSMPYRPAQFMEPGATFPGLAHFVTQTPGRQVDVLLVHGMCTHDASWATETVQRLSSALGANLPPPASAASRAVLGEIEIIPATVPAGDGAIRFQSLIWSPLTTPLKQQLCYDQTGKSPICQGSPPYTPQRASINARVKDLLMDDCLPDALIYQGEARGQIQQRMRDAVLRATAGSAPDAPLVVISESLGSKILFDTLSSMLDERGATPDAKRAVDAAQQTLDRMAYLVMAANQIPILGLADQGLPLDAGRRALPQDSLQRVLERRRARSAAAAAPGTAGAAPASIAGLTLLAFTDPNDLLSYTLQKEKYERPGVAVHNVLVSNARTWFGAFENPIDAHVRYLDNPDVGRLIACGQPKSPLCR